MDCGQECRRHAHTHSYAMGLYSGRRYGYNVSNATAYPKLETVCGKAPNYQFGAFLFLGLLFKLRATRLELSAPVPLLGWIIHAKTAAITCFCVQQQNNARY